ncbi:hypothetical protein SPACI_010860 [Sporomusa acidovorans DSM 3132]|uniref:Chromosome partition protein Smc n=2 Tax=Sporomusa TaxID=2375 RepID=A0ABZ3IZ41_SPOA4|nr:hypothetical protein [Sporomusa acidovorans]OZC16806.1 hypothetical protein SPACI_40260 [Sporomusa acidovorans DSM 3132]SDF79222.1 hypothetical protein SAMN04488499_108411 [Sporomusa acidovorans]
MEELLKQLLEGQKQLTQRLEHMDSRFDKVDSRLDRIESDMASERQQIELSQIVHALRHNSEEVNAQLHNIGHYLNVLTGKAATKEDISELNSKFEVLNSRLFQQEAAIHQLKAVK